MNATPGRSRVLAAAGLDFALVLAFAGFGRASHSQDVLSGLWNTAWPFLLALILGWVVSRGWQAPLAPLRTGVPVWAVTAAGGMLFRWASDQGVQTTFVVVASGILFAFLVGWRLVPLLLAKLRRR